MNRRAITLALAAVGAVAAAQPALATSTIRTREATFRASVKGLQTTYWTADHKADSRCDSAYSGSGSEVVKFASVKPVTVRAFQFQNGAPVFAGARNGHLGDLPTRGTVRRNGKLDDQPTDPSCAVGDGGGGPAPAPPKPDCGTRHFKGVKLRPQYDVLKKGRISLYRANASASSPFRNCPLMAQGWPQILSADDHNRTAGEDLPYNDLFDPSQGAEIVKGEGTVRTNSFGVVGITHITWTLTLRRIKRK